MADKPSPKDLAPADKTPPTPPTPPTAQRAPLALAGDAPVQVGAPLAEGPDTKKTESILIVEDDAVVIRAMEMQLRAAGYKVVAAGSGADAIRATVIQQPDLMILDLTLIEDGALNGLSDGLGLLQWLRHTLPEANFPVIIHTGDTSHNVEKRSRAASINAVFRKGDRPEELLAAVREALDDRKERTKPEA
jgi:two-component system KDP operon response regulator KdpE